MGIGRHLRSGRVAWSAITVRLACPERVSVSEGVEWVLRTATRNIDLAGIIEIAGGVLTGIAKPRLTSGAFAFGLTDLGG